MFITNLFFVLSDDYNLLLFNYLVKFIFILPLSPVIVENFVSLK